MADLDNNGDMDIRVLGPSGYTADVDSSGRLLVSDIVTPPAATTAINQGNIYFPIKNGGFSDHVYVITSGKILTLQRFSGGTDATNGKFALYYDPNGDGVGMTLLKTAYINVDNFQFDLNASYTGNGTASIRMRATNNTSTNGFEFGVFFDGYEE